MAIAVNKPTSGCGARGLLALALVGWTGLHAQFWQEVPIEAPDDVTTDGLFGAALDVEGDLLVVGAPGTDAGAPGSGSAYLYRRNSEGLQTWGFVQRLLPPVPFTGAAFGTDVMFHDGALFISAPRERVSGITRGAVHVYRYNAIESEWVHDQTVASVIPQWQLGMGAELSGADELLVAFASGYDVVPSDDVAAIGGFITFLPDGEGLFQTERLVRGDQLTPTFNGPRLQGWSGACGDSLYYVANDAKAYSIPLDPLRSVGAMLPPPSPVILNEPFDPLDPSTQILNGTSDGSSLFFIVSVPIPDDVTSYKVCVEFECSPDGLVQQGYMVSDTANNDLIWLWGEAVHSGDGLVIVGDPGDLTFTPLGYAEVYGPDENSATRWRRMTTLFPSDPEFGARFGLSVAVGEGFAVVGAPKHGVQDRGKVYGFVDPLVGIGDRSNEPELGIYPSPLQLSSMSGLVHVDLPAAAGSLALTSIDGRFHSERSVTGPVIWDLGQASAGSYQFTWRSRNGGSKSLTGRLIILP